MKLPQPAPRLRVRYAPDITSLRAREVGGERTLRCAFSVASRSPELGRLEAASRVHRRMTYHDRPLEPGERFTVTMLRSAQSRFAAVVRSRRIERAARHHSRVGSQYSARTAPRAATIGTNACASRSRMTPGGSSASIRSYQIGSSCRYGSRSVIAGTRHNPIRPSSVGPAECCPEPDLGARFVLRRRAGPEHAAPRRGAARGPPAPHRLPRCARTAGTVRSMMARSRCKVHRVA